MEVKSRKHAVRLIVDFFNKRFPDKDISFEMQCGYFWEWVDRLESGHIESYCDSESLKIVKKLISQ